MYQMKQMARRIAWAAALGVVTLPCVAQADWQLDPEKSRVEATITEITSSGSEVAHQHALKRMNGHIAADGTLRLPVRLNQTDILDQLGELPPWMASLSDTELTTVVTQLDPQVLDDLPVGESRTETLMLSVKDGDASQQEPLKVRFTRESEREIRVRNAESVSLDGRAIMQNQTARTVLGLLGYQQIDDEVPVELDAVLVDR
ncbi:hypothetical protein ACFO0U_07600 [Chromohalobacter sarecensis]|uniref:Lipid/polyisoprenoid-binding YceI-like domain-containing protein n=1 Tax=Chromohalobacter sarecensis TaxID=245294 RepID=A0ABV9D0U6_9GAMM|nr:hypothetical protein [Chromohalobacter sarecensis]MCK0713906.1 hypothetical protein [Chromohalobacter sarecensis]